MSEDQDNKTTINYQQAGVAFSLVAESGETHQINHVITVGRTITNDIHISSGNISRKHAFLDVINNKLFVKDLGSSNGTFVNGEKITDVTPLAHDDLVQFDDIKFRVCVGSSVSKETPEPVAAGPIEIPKEKPTASPAEVAGQFAPKVDPPEVALKSEPEPQATESKEDSKPPIEPPAAPTPPKRPASLPGSWVEDGKAVEGTRMLDPDQMRALRESIQPKDLAAITGSKLVSNHCNLECHIEGRETQVVELKLNSTNDSQVWELGRNSKSDVVLDHPSVSGRHAQLIHNQGKWKIVNLVSTNGIMINGEKKLSAFLGDGDNIVLGQTNLVFKVPKKSKSAATNSLTANSLWWLKTGMVVVMLAVLFLIYYLLL